MPGPGARLPRRTVLEGLWAGGLLLPASLLGLPVACRRTDDSGEGDEDERFRFAVITDLHVKSDATHGNNLVLAETISILNAHAPALDLVIVPGDLVDDLPSDDPGWYEAHDDTALHQLEALLAELSPTRLLALGNHDYYTAGGGLKNGLTEDFPAREALLSARRGLPGPWYRHDHKGIAFYALNTMQAHPDAGWTPDNCGSFGPEQLGWLESQLSDGVPAVLFFHHPLALDNAVSAGTSFLFPFEVPRAEGRYEKYEGTAYEGWTDPIYALLARFPGQVLAVFVGHGHWFVRDVLDGVPVLMTDSVGNSVQRTAVGEGEEAVPMRYHIVECNLTRGTVAVLNADLFTYNA